VLEVRDLNVYYGNIHAIHDISFSVAEGEIVTMIGANGAGKSSTLNSLSCVIPFKGSITFMGKSLINVQPHSVVDLGLVQVPEGRRIFANLTVKENLEMGAYSRKDKVRIRNDFENVYTRFPRLKERLSQIAGTLSGGEQQMLAMGRALMSQPRMLLMDEPSMGLAPLLVKEIFSIIRDINAAGTTVLLVEQNANMALSIANRAYVMETGRIILSGSASDLMKSEEVRKAYLGG
jgi:branched-chain amino acid transport system ATP-binding protein